MLNRIRASILALTFALIGVPVIAAIPASATGPDYVCDSVTFPAADDSSFQLDLPFSLKLGTTNYSNVFVSTNGVLSFGVSDSTYWDYPSTPSISVAGWDWVTWGDQAYLRYGTTSDSLCIQWSVRQFPNSTGDVTHITLKVQVNPDGSWDGEITSSGWLPSTLRRGIRYTSGDAVVPIEATFTVGHNGVPVETQTCWDGTVIPVTETCPTEPQPVELTEAVECSGVNPYTQAPASWTGYRLYLHYWDGRTVYEETVAQACERSTPNWEVPPPIEKTRTITCRGYEPVSGLPVTLSLIHI